MGDGNFDIGKESPPRKPGRPMVEPLAGNDSSSLRRTDTSNPQKTERPKICGAMTQQCGDGGRGNDQTPQKFVHLVGCRDPNARPATWVRPARRACKAVSLGAHLSQASSYWMNSPHFWTVASAAPQGMIGTEDVEFFGDPSISLSEYTI